MTKKSTKIQRVVANNYAADTAAVLERMWGLRGLLKASQPFPEIRGWWGGVPGYLQNTAYSAALDIRNGCAGMGCDNVFFYYLYFYYWETHILNFYLRVHHLQFLPDTTRGFTTAIFLSPLEFTGLLIDYFQCFIQWTKMSSIYYIRGGTNNILLSVT